MEQQLLPTFGPALVAGPVFLAFELAGKPGHKARHRYRIIYPKGGGKAFVSEYPDPKTAEYEKILKEVASLMMRGRPPTERAVALLVHSFREVPKSWPIKDQTAALNGSILPTSKPDWDNYGKITDALNGVVWGDDSQVCDGRVIKAYSDTPALRIEVREFVVPGTF